MANKLTKLPINSLTVGEASGYDLYDSGQRLLLAEGKLITPSIFSLITERKVFILSDEDNLSESDETKSFPLKQYHMIVNDIAEVFSTETIFDEEKLNKATAAVDLILHELDCKQKVVVDLNRLRNYDNYTYVHSVNTSILSGLIGMEMGFGRTRLRQLTLGAILHDIGKQAIPLNILNKPTKLTHSEMELLHQHPLIGTQILKNLKIEPEILYAIRNHHERWAGHGYPDELRQNEIDIYSKIVAAADVFDSLISDRPYRRAQPIYHGYEMVVVGEGIDFDPKVVQAFKNCVVLYPKGSLVELDSGELGEVVAVSRLFPTRPKVKILYDGQGNPLPYEKTIDLMEERTCVINSVRFEL